jgi:hypothetical protein
MYSVRDCDGSRWNRFDFISRRHSTSRYVANHSIAGAFLGLLISARSEKMRNSCARCMQISISHYSSRIIDWKRQASVGAMLLVFGEAQLVLAAAENRFLGRIGRSETFFGLHQLARLLSVASSRRVNVAFVLVLPHDQPRPEIYRVSMASVSE